MLSCVQLFAAPWTAAHQASLSFTISWSFLKNILVHWVNDAIHPSHPLSPPSPFAFNLSQHQGLFQWVGSSNQVVKLLEFQLHHQSFQWMLYCAVLSHVWLLVSPWTVAHQAPLSMGIHQAKILEWVAMPSSRGSFQLRDQTQVSCTASRFFTVWATREALFQWIFGVDFL